MMTHIACHSRFRGQDALFRLFELLQAHGAHMYTEGHKHTEIKMNKRHYKEEKPVVAHASSIGDTEAGLQDYTAKACFPLHKEATKTILEGGGREIFY